MTVFFSLTCSQKVSGDDELLFSRSRKCVQGTRFYEALQRSLIDFLVGHSGHKIIEVFEESAVLTLGDDHVHHGTAHTLDGGKSWRMPFPDTENPLYPR